MILAPPTSNIENILMTIPYETIHATPQPFQQHGGKNNDLNHLNTAASKREQFDIGEESNLSTIEIAPNDKLDMTYAASGALNEVHQYGFLTPVILPETTLHLPPILNE